MLKVASTHELIEKLKEYEKENGVGAITSIATICNGNRKVEYVFEIANNSEYNRVVNKENYKVTRIEVSSIYDGDLFKDKEG